MLVRLAFTTTTEKEAADKPIKAWLLFKTSGLS
jgi:hypothetical protein